MPHYAKFMKETINNKRKLDEYEIVSLFAKCSAMIQKKLPQKIQDPGSFTMPCNIGNQEFGKAFCDSSASINLMLLSVVKRLSLGELTPTTLSLQIPDRSMTQPEGIIEDVLIKVGKFIFPVDFVVIDKEEDQQVPLLLGRPFLAIGATLIDVKKGEFTLRVGTKEIQFNLNQSLKQPDFQGAHCMRVDDVVPATRGANETRQLASYSNSTRSKLGQNSTRARARLEMLTSRVEQLVTRLEKLARNSKIFCI